MIPAELGLLSSRDPGVRTVLKRNETYWGKGQVPLEISEITYLPIQSDPARIAALTSGEVDFVQDVPVVDLEKLAGEQKLSVNVGPENRSIFLGLNVGDGELKSSDIKGRNPLADKRVRQALSLAIDRAGIQRGIMRGLSIPAALMVAPGVNGNDPALDTPAKVDVEGAKKLLADAGYPSGFELRLNCPNTVSYTHLTLPTIHSV